MNQAGAGPTLALGPCRTHLPMGFGQLPHGVRCDRGAAAAAGPPHRLCARHGRGQTEEPGQECDGGISLLLPARQVFTPNLVSSKRIKFFLENFSLILKRRIGA